MRKIPATMVTQHPDHASKPYWHTSAYISTQYEADEAFRSFSELGAEEYKWDWEGKLVDESVLERLFAQQFDYFKEHSIGKEKFLTFRLPNPKVETEFRVGRAFINIMSANGLATHFGLYAPPLPEVIIPMTESAEEIIAIQDAYVQLRHLDHPLYRQPKHMPILEVIPLFEQVSTIIRSDEILKQYFQFYKKRFKKYPTYFRPYMARSDPALNSGIIPTVLAVKISLSKYKKLSTKMKIPFFPLIGAGSLPFRGGISPDTIDDFMKEYKGIKTTTLQSAFRYDYPLENVKAAIAKLNKSLPLH
ncbi:MAG: phosphoenolpyruvate carboxylase, partial [Chitinophagaceae bacterium]